MSGCHDASMRTTVTLDPEVAEMLKQYAHRRRTSFKAALNELIRRGLSAQGNPGAKRPAFVVRPHSGGFRPGVDPGKLNQLVDQLEAERFARKPGSRR